MGSNMPHIDGSYILVVYTTYIFSIVISPMLVVALPVNSTTSHGT